MNHEAKKQYLKMIQQRYEAASKKAKTLILDEFASVCGYNRKYAIGLISGKKTLSFGKPGRKPRYTDALIPHIRFLWLSMEQISSRRMVAALPLWMPFYAKNKEAPTPTPNEKFLLLKMSPSTLNRYFKKIRGTLKGLSSTRPNLLLKNKIPIQTNDYHVTKPGHFQVDTVAHCGNSLAGAFANTLTMTDVASSWTENRATWTKDSLEIKKAVEDIEEKLPFPMLGFASDCGTEFLNYRVMNYLQGDHRKQKVFMSRSRPYQKNDNAYVEQKNWTHVRSIFGYDRIEDPALVNLMNDIYLQHWNPLHNFFLPSMKLESKIRVGGALKKKHDKPLTPFQRILNSADVSERNKEDLRARYALLDPFVLKRQLEAKLEVFYRTLNREALSRAS
jgi:hypothetical protein